MKVKEIAKKLIEWYGETASEMYRVNKTENYHEL